MVIKNGLILNVGFYWGGGVTKINEIKKGVGV